MIKPRFHNGADHAELDQVRARLLGIIATRHSAVGTGIEALRQALANRKEKTRGAQAEPRPRIPRPRTVPYPVPASQERARSLSAREPRAIRRQLEIEMFGLLHQALGVALALGELQ